LSTQIRIIHAYFPWADALRDRLRARLADREFVIWTEEEDFTAGQTASS
jgi:hypothetical protein